MNESEIEQATDLIVDPDPDERGNLITVAIIGSGRMVALTLNVN